MNYLIGIVAGLILGGVISRQSLFVQQRIYPLLLILIAVFYVIFGFVADAPEVLVTELRVAFAFVMFGLVGFNYMASLIPVGYVGHALYLLTHDQAVIDAAIPAWWPECFAALDIVLAVFVWFVIKRLKEENKKAA